MKKFLIQTNNGLIMQDFGFHLNESVRYCNWFFNQTDYEVTLSDVVVEGEFIPVGSLEFVFEFIEKRCGINKALIKPINIPEQLQKKEFLKREISFKNKNDMVISQPMFVKSQDTYKAFTDVVEDAKSMAYVPDGYYLVSELVEIESEWRMFVFDGKLVGAKHYLGDYTKLPDFKLVDQMIREYSNSPGAYTLDVGINVTGTLLIEIHPFVSCGLYGFNDYRIMPQMFNQGYQFILNEALKL